MQLAHPELLDTRAHETEATPSLYGLRQPTLQPLREQCPAWPPGRLVELAACSCVQIYSGGEENEPRAGWPHEHQANHTGFAGRAPT